MKCSLDEVFVSDERRESKADSEMLEETSELRRSGRFMGGLLDDMKRRYPLYLSDITDALSLQCFSVVMFIFFSVLSASITFGADIGSCFD